MSGRYEKSLTDELIRQHTPLVKRIANHIASRLPAGVMLDDLIQEGMIGLLDALGRFKPQPNLSFESYASMRIRGAIYDACRRNDIMPRHQRDKVDELQQITRLLEHRLGRSPAESEVAMELNMPLNQYHELLESMVGLTPLDDVPEDMLPADPYSNPMESMAIRQFLEKLVDVLKQLPEKQQLVMALHYQQDLSYSEMALVMGLTRGRISQIHTQAMINIRHLLQLNPKGESSSN